MNFSLEKVDHDFVDLGRRLLSIMDSIMECRLIPLGLTSGLLRDSNGFYR